MHDEVWCASITELKASLERSIIAGSTLFGRIRAKYCRMFDAVC